MAKWLRYIWELDCLSSPIEDKADKGNITDCLLVCLCYYLFRPLPSTHLKSYSFSTLLETHRTQVGDFRNKYYWSVTLGMLWSSMFERWYMVTGSVSLKIQRRDHSLLGMGTQSKKMVMGISWNINERVRSTWTRQWLNEETLTKDVEIMKRRLKRNSLFITQWDDFVGGL
jgi:hypothetical protein